MPRPALILWIANAVILPTVGLVIFLTPKSSTPPSNKPSQPTVAPDTESSLKQSDPVRETFLPPLPELPPLQHPTPSVTSLPQKAKSAPQAPSKQFASPIVLEVAPRREVATLPAESIPKKSTRAIAPSIQSFSAPRRSSVTPRREILPANILSVPKNPQPALNSADAQSVMRLQPPPKAIAPPSPPIASPSPLDEAPTPPVVVVEPSPAQKPQVSEEVRSLCQKFPLNSRCKEIPQVALAQINPEPERKLSDEEVESLCQKFPNNSRCENRPQVAVAEPGSEPERQLSDEEVESLCQRFPLNSQCKSNNPAPDTSAPAAGDTTTSRTTPPPDSSLPNVTPRDSSPPETPMQ